MRSFARSLTFGNEADDDGLLAARDKPEAHLRVPLQLHVTRLRCFELVLRILGILFVPGVIRGRYLGNMTETMRLDITSRGREI